MKITWPWRAIAENIREKQRQRCWQEVKEKVDFYMVGLVAYLHSYDVKMAILNAGKGK
ncbi:hypothetical protein ES705_16426 [subsurface metagenome]